MKVLVAGGTGFVGRALCLALSEKKHEVSVLSRNGLAIEIGYPQVSWDAKNLGEWREALTGIGAVINFCGEPILGGRWNSQRKKKLQDSRILSTRALVSALSQTLEKPAVLINASAIGFYGDRGDEELDENSKPGQDFLSKLCLEWEREAQIAQSLGIRAVCLRTGIVLSGNGGALKRMLSHFRLGLGGSLGSGKQWMSWISLEDLTALVIHLIGSDVSGPVNAVSPHPIRNMDFTSALARACHRPALAPVPVWALKLALGEASSLLLSSQHVLPKKAEALEFKFRFPDIDPALDFALKKP